MRTMLRRLLDEETGQDLVEYALLATFIGFSCIAVFDQIRTSIGNTYQAWNTENNSLWSPPNPAAP